MTREEFIKQIAPFVKKYAPQFGIKVYSPIIAQAILESAGGTTYKAGFHNYFGLKYRAGRVTCNNGLFEDGGSEQNQDGSYTDLPSSTSWYSFENMEMGVLGYFQFTDIPNYANLKGVTEPKTYLENIKADGYATSLKYVDNVMAVIDRYNLSIYDTNDNMEADTAGKRLRINVHAGHNPDGKAASGAVGMIKESTEARRVKDEVIRLLKAKENVVFDCTCNDGTSQSNVLSKIVSKCNANGVDLNVSIHFNAGAKDADEKTTGTEVYIYSDTSKAKPYADNVCNKIAGLGFRNRGVKINPSLYVLRKTTAPTMLIECCFVDDKDDVRLYDYKKMAEAIVKGIIGEYDSEDASGDENLDVKGDGTIYRVQCGAYSIKANAESMAKKLKKAGFDAIITNS